MKFLINSLLPKHQIDVLEIYKFGIETKNATFNTVVPSWEEWDKAHLQHSRFVIEIERKIVGWIALNPVSTRYNYSGVAEVSVYIHPDFNGLGLASELMKILIFESENNGIWTLQSSIFPENEASLKLHEKSGFRKVGFREKISKIDEIWRDTILLERRSPNLI
ncbi:GNAT family N-acetyltransferase [Epilithonimonas arachidiradicis]|uniref:N-acetyltransferase n=1 Tax=Epilithonimonas arachidiradicis TaxID=1617282 RepID=A0A420CPJ4_9FLAO|nr:GNAT family N-acetyltransferase [Epilithonimonas arachidiradicis]RKE80340.1 phosphinothricin acetyltransferase [Epilithonimonas arachidiradicis]GGG64344.1 N-acetyltransferase [Epilithonimonas arachidiradicis]